MNVAFDWTITLGQVVQLVVILLGGGLTVQRFYFLLDKRIERNAREIQLHVARLERDILLHSTALADHATRMERWETTLFKLVADLQRVIGRVEVQQTLRWDGTDRREGGT